MDIPRDLIEDSDGLCVRAIRLVRKEVRDGPRHGDEFLRRAALRCSTEIIKRQWAVGFLHDRNPEIREDFIVLDIHAAPVGRDITRTRQSPQNAL
jgi:hypothetical protein